MGKYDFIKTENIVSVHKVLKLEYEAGYSGSKKELIVKVYPYTVEEKLNLANLNEQLKAAKTDEEIKSYSEELNIKSALYVLQKDDEEADEEVVKKLPAEWINKLTYKALEFEGFEENQLKDLAKKEIGKSQA